MTLARPAAVLSPTDPPTHADCVMCRIRHGEAGRRGEGKGEAGGWGTGDGWALWRARHQHRALGNWYGGPSLTLLHPRALTFGPCENHQFHLLPPPPSPTCDIATGSVRCFSAVAPLRRRAVLRPGSVRTHSAFVAGIPMAPHPPVACAQVTCAQVARFRRSP